MESSITYVVICATALSASALSLLSGFGLGTVLTPVFAIFFPITIAVALAAIVHFLNSVFKLILVGRYAGRNTVIRFGIPAIPASLLGAQVLVWLANQKPLVGYHIHGHGFEITVVKLVVTGMMMLFALLEMVPRLEQVSFDRKYLPVGGILSGFFGGLSGHQFTPRHGIQQVPVSGPSQNPQSAVPKALLALRPSEPHGALQCVGNASKLSPESLQLTSWLLWPCVSSS